MKRRLSFILLALCHSPVYANNINATSNPVANSSGSVTNFAVQNLPSRQFTNQYGGGIVCQGDTLAVQPFLSSNLSFAEPNVQSWEQPIYSTRDLTGSTDDEGNPAPDGEPDNPSEIIGYQTKRRFEKKNYAISPGISISWNIQLDRRARRICLDAAEKQRDLFQAAYEDKRLSYELGRMKICAEQMKLGVTFKPTSRYYKLCEDIALINPPGVLPEHRHSINVYPKSATSDQ